jgi:hypothetical protein
MVAFSNISDLFSQHSHTELADAGDTLRRMNDGLQLQLAELAGSAKSRDAVAADTRAQLESIYRQIFPPAAHNKNTKCTLKFSYLTTCNTGAE